METRPVTIEFHSDISGFSAFKDVTTRIISITKIKETGEVSPGSFEVGEVTFELNDFDDWYTDIYLNYFYDDPKASGQGNVYVYIYLNGSIILWAGYLIEPVLHDDIRHIATFKFRNFIGQAFDFSVEMDFGVGPEERFWFVTTPLFSTLGRSIALFETDIITVSSHILVDTIEIYDVGGGNTVDLSHVGIYLNSSSPYFSDGDLSGESVPVASFLHGCAVMFIAYLFMKDGVITIGDKNGSALSGNVNTIDLDDIIAYEPISDDWRYDGVKINPLSGGGQPQAVHEGRIDPDRFLELDVNQTSLVAAQTGQKVWGPAFNLGINAAEANFDYYTDQQDGIKLELDGLEYWVGQIYEIPSELEIRNESYYVSRTLYRDLEKKTTELHLFPRQN